MNQPNTHLAAETEVVREVYAALNRNDISSMVKAFAPHIEWTEPDDFPGGGTRHGIAAVKSLLSRARGNWAEGMCVPEEFLVCGDHVIALDYVHVRLKDETKWREARLGAVYTFRDGKVVRVRIFGERHQALAWVGITGSSAD